MAIDARYHRRVQGVAQSDPSETPWALGRPVVETRGTRVALHVGTGRERAIACPRQHNHTHFGRFLKPLPDGVELCFCCAIDRIEYLRSVDRHVGDMIIDIETDRH